MNKKAKFMLVALSAAAITTGAFALAGCNKKDNGSNVPSATELYETYKAYAEANNQTALTYEQWLATIQSNIKGDKGEAGATGATGATGAQGAQGEKGEDGAAGRGVSGMAWGEVNGAYGLTITYTDGTSSFVAFPKEVTHVHAYNDENVITLIPATEEADGLGYKVCTDSSCNHVEMVILSKRYIVTVTDMANNPVAGAIVTINGAKGVTDEDGVAEVSGYGYKNDYIVAVTKEGYSVAGEIRTGEAPEIAVTMGKQFATVQDDFENEYPGIVEEGTYTVTLGSRLNEDYSNYPNVEYNIPAVDQKEIKLEAGDTAKYFKITLNSNYAVLQDNTGSDLLDNGSYSVLLFPGEQKGVYFTADLQTLEQLNHNFGSADNPTGDNVIYTITVEELALPDEGTEALPITVNAGEEITLPAATAADGWVYYRWVTTNNSIESAKFTLPAGAEAKFTKIVLNEDCQFEYTEINVANNTDFEIKESETAGTYTFRIKAAAGAKFTLSTSSVLGSNENPKEVTALGEEVSLVSENSKWFKYTVTEAGKYAITASGWDLQMCAGYCPSDYDYSAPIQYLGTEEILELAVGDYFFRVDAGWVDGEEGEEGGFICTLKIEKSDASSGDEDENTYEFIVKDEDGNTISGVTVTLQYYDRMNNQFVTVASGTTAADGKVSLTVEEDGFYMIKLSGYDTTQYALSADSLTTTENGFGSYEMTLVGPADHTITVTNTSGTAVAGVTVKIYETDGDEEVVLATGQTNAEGKVTLNFLPGEHYIGFVDLSSDYYFSGYASTSSDSTEASVTLRTDKATKTFTVKEKGGDKLFAGATVTVTNTDGKVLATDTTGADGKVTLSFFMEQDGPTYAKIESDEVVRGYSYVDGTEGNLYMQSSDEGDGYTIELVKDVEYTVTVLNANGSPLKGATLVLRYGTKVVDTVVTGNDGRAVLSGSAAQYTIVCTEGVPAGYNAAKVTTSNLNEDQSFTIMLSVGDYAATGAASDNGDNMLPDLETCHVGVGTNVLTNSDAANRYYFKPTRAGKYTFAIGGRSETAYISYLKVGNDVLINNGRQIMVANGVVLGANRGSNKAYEVTLDLTSSDSVIIAYHTGTEDGAIGQMLISAVYPISEGSNALTLNGGSVTCTYNFIYSDDYAIQLEWEEEDVTVTVDGKEVESGYYLENEEDATVTVVVTSASQNSVTLTVTTVETVIIDDEF